MSLIDLKNESQKNLNEGIVKIESVVLGRLRQAMGERPEESSSDSSQGNAQQNQTQNQNQNNPVEMILSGLMDVKTFENNDFNAQKLDLKVKKALRNHLTQGTKQTNEDLLASVEELKTEVGKREITESVKVLKNSLNRSYGNFDDSNRDKAFDTVKKIMSTLVQLTMSVESSQTKAIDKNIGTLAQALDDYEDYGQRTGVDVDVDTLESHLIVILQGKTLIEKQEIQEQITLGDVGIQKIDAGIDALNQQNQQNHGGQGQQNQQGGQNQQNQQGQGSQNGGSQGSQNGGSQGNGSQGSQNVQNGSQSGQQGNSQGNSQKGSQGTSNGSQGMQNQQTVSANNKMSSAMSGMSSALNKSRQQNGQGQNGQGQGQNEQGQGSGGQGVDRNADGTPKNPFAGSQQKGQGNGSQGTNISVDGADGNGNGTSSDSDINRRPSEAGQGNSLEEASSNGVSPGFSRDSYSTGKKSGFANTAENPKQAMDQISHGKPHYGANDFASGKKNVDQSLQKKVTVSYNGKKLTGTVSMDVLSNHDKLHQNAGGEATNKRIEESKLALQRIKTKLELEKEKNAELDKDNSGRFSDRYIEFGLESNMSWKKLLKKCLQKERRGSSYSYLQPNRRYSNMGLTVVSRVKDKKVEVIKNVKVCVDTSGSVSTEELNLYLSQIARLIREFDNVEGELLYWSNAVTDAGPFKRVEDLKKIHVGSTGGTDVRCVFEYLNGETKCDGKKEETKPKDMAAIIIITDGCFYNNYEDYAKIFGKPSHKVIWMIEGNAQGFKPPFGNVVQITRQGD